MGWGVFEVRNDGELQEVHVMPCDDDGCAMPPHISDGFCPCQPEATQEPGCVPVYVHEMEQ